MFIGREHEISLIRGQLADRRNAKLIVLYGRRRIGKSRLIHEFVQGEVHCPRKKAVGLLASEAFAKKHSSTCV